MNARTLALEALRAVNRSVDELDEYANILGDPLRGMVEQAMAALEAETGEVVAPTPWPSLSGNYIFPSPTRDSRLFGNAPAAPDIGILKEVTEALAARLGTNADEWPLVRAARAIVEDAS